MCKDCRYWTQNHNSNLEKTSWGECTVEWGESNGKGRISHYTNPDYQEPMMAVDYTGYGYVTTTATFSCILFTPAQLSTTPP